MRIQADAAKVVEKAGDLYTASRKVTRKSARKAKSFIHARPFVSLVLGVTAGCVLAHLFAPWNSD